LNVIVRYIRYTIFSNLSSDMRFAFRVSPLVFLYFLCIVGSLHGIVFIYLSAIDQRKEMKARTEGFSLKQRGIRLIQHSIMIAVFKV